MKKYLLIAILAVASVCAYAQPRAIGVRLGYGAEVSYEHQLGQNMLSVEVGVPAFSSIEAAITYDWIDPFGATVPWNEKGEWHWYMGVGGAGGLYNFSNPTHWFAGVAGHIGIEYDFWFPLQLSVDWRPSFGVSNWNEGDKINFDLHGLYGISLGVRYKF